jgi:hypothetical protein
MATLASLKARLEAVLKRLPQPKVESTLQPELRWLEFCSTAELDVIDQVYRQDEPTEADRLTAAAIYTDACRRQAAGWPTYDADPGRYTAVDLRHERDGTLSLRPFRP